MKILSFAIVNAQRDREEMEDTYCFAENFAGERHCIFGGVYDGHGGDKVSLGLSGNMSKFVREEIVAGISPEMALLSAYAKAANSDWAQGLHQGSCAANFFIRNKTIVCANVGDCRIIVAGNYAHQLTRDHNVRNKIEVKRVTSCGARLHGNYVEYEGEYLMPTRVIGDLHFKNAGIIPIPFISTYHFKKTDRFIIAGTDGLFLRKLTNRRVLAISRKAKNAKDLASALEEEVEKKLGTDNLTIIVVQIG